MRPLASGGSSLVTVLGLLIAVASLVAEHRLQGMWAQKLLPPGSRAQGSAVVVHRLRGSAACAVLLDQGSNLCLLHWQEPTWGAQLLGIFILIHHELHSGLWLNCTGEFPHPIPFPHLPRCSSVLFLL